MQVIQQSFSHSSSSFMIGKIQGNIVDLLYAPLSATEVTISVSLAAVTRSFMIAAISIVVFYFMIDIPFFKRKRLSPSLSTSLHKLICLDF